MSDWAIWGALIVVFLAGVAALALVVVRSLEALRDFKRTRRRAARRLDELVVKGEALAERAETAGDTAELNASVASLRIAVARLAVLADALDEVEAPLARLAAVLPRR